MAKDLNIRWGWLKGMYIFTIFGAGGFGLGMIVIPDLMRTMLGWPSQDPVMGELKGKGLSLYGLMLVVPFLK